MLPGQPAGVRYAVRKPFEKIVEELLASSNRDEEMGLTLGELAERHRCTAERIADALDCIKILAGKRTYVEVSNNPIRMGLERLGQ
jgi:hypothetical protein